MIDSEVGACRRAVLERLMVALVVVVLDKFINGFFQVRKAVIVFKLDHVLHRPLVSLNLSLDLWMVLGTMDFSDALLFHKLLDIFRYVA